MQEFHNRMKVLFAEHDMDLLSNLGRRNIIMSQVQEKFVAEELAKKYTGVVDDGRPGQPDILVGELGRELECKMVSQGASKSWYFGTDHGKSKEAKVVDYLYILSSKEFDEFAVLYFDSLTLANHFRFRKNQTSRRVEMIKHKTVPKCTALVGSIKNLKIQNISILEERIKTSPSTRVKGNIKMKARLAKLKASNARYSFILEKVDSPSA